MRITSVTSTELFVGDPRRPRQVVRVAVDDASDRDRLRLALSGEAGLNDGTALPFVVLALLLLGDHGSASALGKWLGLDFAWPLAGGLGIGFALGWLIGWIGVRMKTASADVTPNDVLALALMAAGRVDRSATQKGIDNLIQSQGADGFWQEPDYTGGGFPRVFYLRYHGYSKFFPLWAMARYRNLRSSNSRFVGAGM